jgi:hypothetical protein
MVALYRMGSSMRAASANADSFCCGVVFLDMIGVKFTNCTQRTSSRHETHASPRRSIFFRVYFYF